MKGKRAKLYNPNSVYNPAFQARKLKKLATDINNHSKAIQAISKSHDNHISFLGNFARHDIKNAIQSMDSILSTTKESEFDESKIESLSTYLEVIRHTIDNFAKLIPYSTSGKFQLSTLLVAVELLARADMQKNVVDLEMSYDRNSQIDIGLPFQSVLQMLNNLIINSLKSLENIYDKRMLISAEINEDDFTIKIEDNGCLIPLENIDCIFDWGFSTTGGSGIGLYHAKYLCDQFEGEIRLELQENSKYNKAFIVKLPTIKKYAEDSINN